MKVYIACPISIGDRKENYRRAMNAACRLTQQGHSVINPAAFMLEDWAFEIPYEQWMQTGYDWIGCVDLVYRISGESRGADLECEYAELVGVRVVREGVGDFAELISRHNSA